jgi:hypothetical protein
LNQALDGLESVQRGTWDLLINSVVLDAQARGANNIGGVPIENIESEWNSFKDENKGIISNNIGTKLTDEEKQKNQKEFLTKVFGSLAYSGSAMAGGFPALFAQAADSGMQAVNSSEAGKSMPTAEKTLFAVGTGLAIGALDKLSLNIIFGKQASKIATNLALKTMSDLMKKSSKPITIDAFQAALDQGAKELKRQVLSKGSKVVVGSGVEGVTEWLQEGTSIIGEEVTNRLKKEKIFEPESWGSALLRMNEAGKYGAAGGGLLGGIASFGQRTQNHIADKVSNAKSAEDIENIKNEIVQQAEKGNFSQEETKAAVDLVNKYAEVNLRIPQDANNRKEVADKIIERDDIEHKINERTEEMKSVDPAFRGEMEAEINLLHERANEINSEIVAESQSPTKDGTYLINNEPVTEEQFNEALDKKQVADYEYNGEDEAIIEKVKQQPQGSVSITTPEQTIYEEPTVKEETSTVSEKSKSKITLSDKFANIDGADNAVKEVFELGDKNPMNDKQVIVNGVKVNVERDGDKILLKEISAIEQGKGSGTKVLNQIQDIADKNDIDIVLSPTKINNTTEKQLNDWYKKNGFVDYTQGRLIYKSKSREVQTDNTTGLVPRTNEAEKVKTSLEEIGDARTSLSQPQPTNEAKAIEVQPLNIGNNDVTLQNKTETDADNTISQRLRPEEEQGRTASGSLNAEATSILQRVHGAVKKAFGSLSSRKAKSELLSKEKQYIEDYTKQTGQWFDNPDVFGEKVSNGQEQEVYHKDGDTFVTKLNDLSLNENVQDFLDRVALHNTHFPSTAYEVIGFGKNKAGDFVAITKQPFIKGDIATQQEIVDYMKKRGFKQQEEFEPDIANTEEAGKNFVNDDVIVEDLHRGNVIKGVNGEMFVIDPDIKLNTKQKGFDGKREITEPKIQQPTKVESTTIKETNKVGEGAEETQKTYTKNALDRADAKKIYAQVREVDVPQDAAQIALEYIANGGKVSEEAINQVAGSVKRASLNTGRKEKRSAEYNLRDYASKTNETLDALAHRLWEANDQRISEMDIKDALMDAIGSHSTRLDAGKTYLERYSAEYQENKLQEKFYQEHLEEIAAEEKAINEWLNSEDELLIDAMADEKFVTNLIEKYESETKGEDKQSPTKTESSTNKGTGSETSTQKTEAGEPPVVPPVPPITNTERSNEGELKDKGILASMYKSVPESAKGKVEAVGLKYRVQSQAEAKAIATQIVEDNGIDVALEYASNAKLDGDVRSMIYNVSLNKLAEMEVAETDVVKKAEMANTYSDALIEFDEMGRDAGRFNSAIFDFYKSPLGMEFYTNKKREKAFKEKQAEYGKSWDDFYEQYKDEPEFAAMVQAEILNEKMKKPGFAKKAADSLRKKADDILKNGITPDWLKADVKDAKTKGIDRKVVDKAIAKALKIIADAIEVGGNIASVVAEQVKKIKELGVSAKDSEIAKWLYKESGATGMDAKTFEDKVSDRIKSLEGSIAEYKKKLADKEYSEKEQPATNDKIKELEQELKDAKNAYYEARKDFPAYKQKVSERYLQRMKKKLDGLNERQRRKVVEESFRKLAENGALSQEEFREIIGNTLGLGKLTPEQANKLRGYVEDINAVDDARMEYVETDGSESSKKKLAQAEKKSLESKSELGNIVYTESNVWDTIRAAMQLTAIGVPTIMKNFAWNFVAQGLIKFPANAVVSLGDAAIAKAANILNLPYSRTTSFMGKEQGAFFRHLREGVIEGSRAVRYGINSKDYFEKGVSTKPIQPIKSGVEFLDWAKGNSDLTFAQGMDKLIKASWVGYYMEGVARGLTFFDKPLRYAAEGGTASRIAKKELGLSDVQAKVFERVPKEFAIKHYMSKGDNLAQATKKAEVIVDRIKEVGDKSVAQQANLLSETINKIGQYAKQKTEDSPAGKTIVGAGKVIGAPMALFIKTPANIAWQVFSLINPSVAVAQAGIFSANAYKKYKKGDVTYTRDLDRAKDWMGTAAVGIGLGMLGQFLTGIGVVESGEDEDTKKKERDATKQYSKKFTFNYSKFNRYKQGIPDSKDDEDIRIDLSWFGQVGAMMDMKQRMAELSKDNPDLSYTDKLTEELTQSAKIAISSSALNSASALSTAFSSYDGFKGFGVNYLNTMANIVQPQAFAQDSRAAIDYEYQVKADKFWKQLDNTFTARSSLYRYLTDKYPPSDIGIWGDKIDKGGSKYLRYFGISKDKKNPFAQEIYNDAERTGSLDFLPPSVKNKITKNGESIKLNTEQERYLEEQVGKERKRLVTAYMSGAATIPKYGKYSSLSDKDKKDALEVIYKAGFNVGKYYFFEKYPQLNHEKTEQEKENDKEESKKRKGLNEDIKKKQPKYW